MISVQLPWRHAKWVRPSPPSLTSASKLEPVEVQVQLSSGLPAFIIVGLPDKAVAESRERVRAALAAIGLALPPRRITVNLSPADLPKEDSHFDLPIALSRAFAWQPPAPSPG